jgi:hypothetical protein
MPLQVALVCTVTGGADDPVAGRWHFRLAHAAGPGRESLLWLVVSVSAAGLTARPIEIRTGRFEPPYANSSASLFRLATHTAKTELVKCRS